MIHSRHLVSAVLRFFAALWSSVRGRGANPDAAADTVGITRVKSACSNSSTSSAPIGVVRFKIGLDDTVCVVSAWQRPNSDAVVISRVATVDCSTAHHVLLLDAFADLYALAEGCAVPTVVIVKSAALFRELAQCTESFPSIRLVDKSDSRATRLSHHVSAHLDAGLGEKCPVERTYEFSNGIVRDGIAVTVIASDASVLIDKRVAGIACVATDETSAVSSLRTHNVKLAELEAIHLALRSYKGRPVQVLTDSRPALCALLADPASHDKATAAVINRIRYAMGRRPVTVTWIKGHVGHELNEAADRLAKSAARSASHSASRSGAEAVAV